MRSLAPTRRALRRRPAAAFTLVLTGSRADAINRITTGVTTAMICCRSWSVVDQSPRMSLAVADRKRKGQRANPQFGDAVSQLKRGLWVSAV